MINDYFEKMLRLKATKQDAVSRADDIRATEYPEFLYKYRECNDNAFSLISDEYLWAAKPKDFDDPTDSLVSITSKEEACKIEKWMHDNIIEICFFYLRTQGLDIKRLRQEFAPLAAIFEEGRNYLKEGKFDEYWEFVIPQLPARDQIAAKDLVSSFRTGEAEKNLSEAVEKAMRSAANSLRDSIFVTSLTDRKDNFKMWETYADKYSGFLIEYDILASLKDRVRVHTIQSAFPVIYQNERPSLITADLVKTWFAHISAGRELPQDVSGSSVLLTYALYKKEEYREEREWRVISSTNKLPAPVISAVYAGRKMREEHEARLKKVCAEKQIPLFRQEIDSIAGRMTFKRHNYCQ